MSKYLSIAILPLVGALLSAAPARADYSNTVVSLHPVAYWPLNETVQPPAAYIATNSGSLGAAGNGYYETWFASSNNGYVSKMDWTGPVAGATSDGDGAANINNDGNNYIQIPHTYSGTVIHAPFSVECWAYSTNTGNLVNLVGAGGQYARTVDSVGNWAGFSLSLWSGNWLFDLYNTNGSGHSVELSAGATANQWNHLVGTFDGTNVAMYLNGVEVAAGVANTNSAGLGYIPDAINPIVMGQLNRQAGYVYPLSGSIDEVAIYTNILSPSDVANHYNAATGGGYYNSVINNNPLIYLRLDEPLYTLPPSNTFASFPPANNYGSLGSAANGLYQPGTLPGMPGPTGAGFGAANYSVAINGQDAAVDVGNGNLTNVAPALNVTGTNALSIVTWFKGDPADGYNHFQGIVGRGNASWRFGFGGSGPQFNPGNGGEIASSGVYNDGQWHMAAGIYDGSTNYIYVDGKLVNRTAYSGSQAGSGLDVTLGGAPDYTSPGGRYWGGNLAQVAFFTNALSATNVVQIYNNAGIFPYITMQPVSATVNAGVSYSSTPIIAGSSLAYQWYQNGYPVSGQTNLSLTYNPVQGGNAGSYYVVATNNEGAVTSSIVTLTVNTSPQVTSQTGTNFVLIAGGSATFSLSAIGAVPVYYYWSSNGVVISASTSSNYVLTNAQSTASYVCLVSNFLGSVSSAVVSVMVVTPTNTYPQTVVADNPLAYWRLDEPDQGYPNNGIIAHDAWGGNNGVYTNTDLSQAGYTATPADPDTAALFGAEAVADSDMQVPGISFAAPNGSNAEFTVEAWVNVTLPQYLITDGSGIIAKGSGGGGEQFNLDTGAGSEAFRFFVRDAGGGVHLANSSIIADNNWHHLVGVCDEANGTVALYVDGALAASTTIGVGSGLLSSTSPVSIGSRQSGGTGSYDDQFPGVIDEVAIYNRALSVAQVKSHYQAIGGFSPVIAQQPTNVTVNAGSTATFSAGVNGSPVLSYQWYDVTAGFPGTPISGATSSTLILSGVTANESGNLYALVVTNASGQATTTSAQLTVLAGSPTLQADLQPLYERAFVGMPLTFSVAVGGTPPFYYQWYQDGSPVGPHTNTYQLSVVAGTNTYYCFITNSSGTISSSTATIVGVSITNTGTNSATSSTTFAINFVDAANGAYSPDGGTTYYNIVYQGLGVYADNPANTNWNGFGIFPNGYTPAPNSAVAPQVASDGTLTPVTLNLIYGFDSSPIYFGPGVGGNATQGEPSVLFGATAVVNTSSPGIGTSSNPLGGITLSNVPSGTYTLYLLGVGPGNDRGAVFNFTSGIALGGTNTVLNANNGSPASNIVYSATYVIYTNVSPDANGTISGTWGAVNNPYSGNSGEGDFNGLQLVRVSGSTVVAQPMLAIHLAGANAVVSWNPTNGTLQSATSVTGPYTDVTGVTSPYTNAVSGTQQFFRVKQ